MSRLTEYCAWTALAGFLLLTPACSSDRADGLNDGGGTAGDGANDTPTPDGATGTAGRDATTATDAEADGTIGSSDSAAQSDGQTAVDGSPPPLDCPPAPTGSFYAIDASGITFTVSQGKLRLQVCTPDIIRVEYANASALPTKASLSVNATWGAPDFCVADSSGTVTITTARMKANVATASGLVTFTDLSGNILLSEASKTVTPASVEGVSTHTVATSWTSPANEGLFGLGQRKDGTVNRKGQQPFQMLNANGWIYIPLVISSKGYGIFWDNPSTTQFDGNASNNTRYSFSSETGDMVDYYYFYGPTIDQVVAGYRATTGAPPLFPKWAYGLFQSHDHYQSSQELINVDNGYRSNNIPVDAIVQDWDYWNPYVWGSQLMDRAGIPIPPRP